MSEEKTRTSTRSKNGRSRLNVNVWIIIGVIILIYLIVRFCTYFLSDTTSLYEVVSGSTEGRFNTQYTALVLREETVVNAAKTGYVNFFIGDATPVSVGAQTYVIDESGELSARLEEASRNQTILDENELRQIKNTIYDFDTSYDPNSYYDTYYFKYRLESQVLDLINSNVFGNLNSGVSGTSEGTYTIGTSEISGIMQHSVDGFEGLTEDDIEAAMFRRANYSKKIIKSNDLIEEGAPVCKVVTSENWKLIIQLSSEDAYEDLDYVTIEFLSDGIMIDAPFETFTKAGARYGMISLDKYMIRYISDRYVSIQIVSDTVSGLKIPKSAVGEEQFYIIPVEFMTQGGNSTGNGFIKQVINSDGTTSVDFTDCQIFKLTDEYAYVSVNDFESGDILIQPDTNIQYKITAKENLQGAYISAGGNYSFTIVDILGEENGFYIVSEYTSGGLRIYDQILKDASEHDKR